MSAIPAIPSPIRWITTHAFVKYAELIDPSHPIHIARVGIMRIVRCSTVMTDVQLRYWHVRIEAEATYRMSETSAGRFVIVVKDSRLVTLFRLGE